MMKRSVILNIQHIHSSFKRYPVLFSVRVSYVEELLNIIVKQRILKFIFHIVKFHISLKFHQIKISPCTQYGLFFLIVKLTKLKEILYSFCKRNSFFLQLSDTYLYHLMHFKMHLFINCGLYYSMKFIDFFKF